MKGERREGPFSAKHIVRIVIIGVPVLALAWLFLRWLHAGFR